MTITYLGELTVGAAVPGVELAITAGLAGINAALTNLNLQLAALNAFVPTPMDFSAQLALAQDVVLSVQLAISSGLVPPDMSAQLAIVAAQIGALTALINGVIDSQNLLISMQAPLAAAGVHAYAYDGAAADCGNELDAALGGGVPGGSGGGQHANAVIMVTVIPATWDALGEIVKVTP